MDWLKHFIINRTYKGVQINGLKQGIWYDDSDLEEFGACTIETCIDDKIHGVRAGYSFGVVDFINDYKNDQRDGSCRSWHLIKLSNGNYRTHNLFEHREYKHNMANGICITWYRDGSLQTHGTNVNNKQHGITLSYPSNNRIIANTFIHDKLVSRRQYNNRKLQSVEIF